VHALILGIALDPKAPGHDLILAAIRSPVEQPFGPAELDQLEIVAPHLRRGLRFWDRVRQCPSHTRGALEALDRLGDGAMLLDGEARLLAHSPAVCRVFDGLLGIEAGHLRAHSAQDKAALAAALAVALGSPPSLAACRLRTRAAASSRWSPSTP
jgi:hypothetical protein